MPVDISIDSFPANDFAPIEGLVESIGSDVLDSNERVTNEEYFYPWENKTKFPIFTIK